MPKFHFVEDYERYVSDLIAAHPLDEAMALAVGGNYEVFGKIQSAVLEYLGVQENWRVLDLGCGSGRLASALHQRYPNLRYTGIDVIRPLLEYAKSKAPNYRFILNRSLSLPMKDETTDCVLAFSLFTHLMQAETYQYLEEAYRVLAPGGVLCFSFVEFNDPAQWHVFEETLKATRTQTNSHLTIFIERSTVIVWTKRIGFDVIEFIDGQQHRWDGLPMGQSLVILRKPHKPLNVDARVN